MFKDLKAWSKTFSNFLGSFIEDLFEGLIIFVTTMITLFLLLGGTAFWFTHLFTFPF